MPTQSRSFTPSLIDPTPTTPSLVTKIAGLIAQILLFVRACLRAWSMRLDDRAYLAGLRDYEVHEMGLTLDQRDREARKAFWEA